MKTVFQKITAKNDIHIIDISPLSGGDINEVFLLKCDEANYVVKLNNAIEYAGMFEAESKGLKLLKQTKSFKIPEVIDFGNIESTSFLLMEHIESGDASVKFWNDFALNLSIVHKTSQKNFGLSHDNFIGSLPQINNQEISASKFYINNRLEPQFQLAFNNGFCFSELENIFKNITDEIPNEPPALIHGDLWNGNYLVSKNNIPVLIDPAVSYASREMDIAMMDLFGGFPNSVFSEYNNFFPLEAGWKKRIPIWQLYYLLVHLNLFGSGYLSRVKNIISLYK